MVTVLWYGENTIHAMLVCPIIIVDFDNGHCLLMNIHIRPLGTLQAEGAAVRACQTRVEGDWQRGSAWRVQNINITSFVIKLQRVNKRTYFVSYQIDISNGIVRENTRSMAYIHHIIYIQTPSVIIKWLNYHRLRHVILVSPRRTTVKP